MLFSLELKYYFLFSFLVYVTAGANFKFENNSYARKDGDSNEGEVEHANEENAGSAENKENTINPPSGEVNLKGDKESDKPKSNHSGSAENRNNTINAPSGEDNSEANEESDKSESDDQSGPVKKFLFDTFDLSQDVANHYESSGILKSLENVEGLDFTEEQLKKFKIWPRGIIPYYIDSLSFDKVLSDKIRDYLDVTNSLTGLHFRELPRPPEDDNDRWIFFLNRKSTAQCWEYNRDDFSDTGVQRTIVGYDCLQNGQEIASLVMAILQIPNQHNSPDRDTHVTYNEDSVLPGKERFYTKVNDDDWLFNDTSYDFRSVTHFPFYKNSRDGKAVLTPKVPTDFHVGETKGYSYIDAYKIRRMYNLIKSRTDEKIQFSNCKKLYQGYDNNLKKPQALNAKKRVKSSTEPVYAHKSENDVDMTNLYGKDTPKESNNNSTAMSKQGNLKKSQALSAKNRVTSSTQIIFANRAKNNAYMTNVLVYGKDTAKESNNNANTMAKQGPVNRLTKLSHRVVKEKSRAKLNHVRPYAALKDDPLKWDDIRSDD